MFQSEPAGGQGGGSGVDPGWFARPRRDHLDALVREHRPFLEAMARRLCRSQLDPGDLVQDVLERLVTGWGGIPAEVPVRAWLVRVMHNRFIDLVRRVRVSAPIDQLVAPEPEPEAWWHRLSTAEVCARLDALPAPLREAFRLHAVEGLSYPEIARRLGTNRSTVGTRILRARRRLRALFAGEGGS